MLSKNEALLLKNELDNLRPLTKEKEGRIMQKFRFALTYHSCTIEGNSLTYAETKALLLHGITAQGKPLRDHIEITGHDEAIKWIEDLVKGDYPLTENFIRELHTLLLKDPYEVQAITPEGKPKEDKNLKPSRGLSDVNAVILASMPAGHATWYRPKCPRPFVDLEASWRTDLFDFISSSRLFSDCIGIAYAKGRTQYTLPTD